MGNRLGAVTRRNVLLGYGTETNPIPLPEILAGLDMEANMEETKEYTGSERRAHPRFSITFPAFLRLTVMKEGNPTILELGGQTADISLEGIKLSIPAQPEAFPALDDAKEGRGVDVGVEIVTEKKRIKAVGDIRWFKAEPSQEITVGILLKGMGREDRKIWEELVKSLALSL
jgi:hypothetical protein